jgi:hypothetical protein
MSEDAESGGVCAGFCCAPEGKPCYSAGICNICFVWPLGGLIGLFVSAYGYFNYLSPGYTDAEKALNGMGIDTASLGGLVGAGSVIFLMANLLVVGYGFREKFRTRLNKCHHFTNGAATTIKFAFKGVLHTIVLSSVGMVLALFVMFEALWIMLIVVKALCDAGGVSVKKIFILNFNSFLINELKKNTNWIVYICFMYSEFPRCCQWRA